MRRLNWIACGLVVGFLLVGFAAPALRAQDAPKAEPAIDWNRARDLLNRERKGEKLSPEDRAYLDRAKEVRRKEQGRLGGQAPMAPPAPRDSIGLKPLTEMTADDKYKGEDGGLYGAGANEPPKPLAAAAAAELAKIVPLDADGRPAPDGKIVLISIGMSNTTQEFSRFKQLAEKDADKSPQVAIVDCAQGGKAAAEWDVTANRNAQAVWDEADRRIKAAGVTAQHVQVVWLKQAIIAPARLGEFPEHAKVLKKHTESILALAKAHFPNLRIAYLSSRIYAGYATTGLNPEPYSYESAFAVRWVIQDQQKGAKELNWDAAKGEVKAPLVLWGPYLWADGVTPRKADGLVYKREDLGPDGTHPSPTAGREKVGAQLLKFLKTDPLAKGWFLRPADKAAAPAAD